MEVVLFIAGELCYSVFVFVLLQTDCTVLLITYGALLVLHAAKRNKQRLDFSFRVRLGFHFVCAIFEILEGQRDYYVKVCQNS